MSISSLLSYHKGINKGKAEGKIEAFNEVLDKIVMMSEWDNEFGLRPPIIDAQELLIFIEKRREEVKKGT